MKSFRKTATLFAALVLLITAGRAQAVPVLLVSNAGNNGSVVRFDPFTGAGQGTFIVGGFDVAGSTQPRNAFGLAVTPAGNVAVVDPGDNQVKTYNGATGAFISRAPTGLFFSQDIVYTTPNTNYFVSGFNSDQVRGFTAAGAPNGLVININDPTGLAIRGNELFVATNPGVIFRFDATTGAQIGGTFAVAAPGAFDLAFNPANGDLFVSAGASIFRFSSTGTPIGSPITNPALTGAFGLGFGPDGNLYVVNNPAGNSNPGGPDPGDAVLRFNPTTGAFLGTFATGNGLDEPQYLLFADIAVPEPASVALFAIGGLGLVAAGRGRMRRRTA